MDRGFRPSARVNRLRSSQRANGRCRRILPIPVGAGERPFTERTAAARPWRREPLTLEADARHHARIGILGGEQRCTMPSRAPRAPSLLRNLR
jgi:hypothetical protein